MMLDMVVVHEHRSEDALPPWAAAIPLWAGADWLWIDVSLPGRPRFVYEQSAASDSATDVAPLARVGSLIVLQCGSKTLVPSFWWPQLQSALDEGGTLFVCGSRDILLPEQISAHASSMRPAEWHVIEPEEDGTWRVRPDSRRMQEWYDRHLNPPFGLRTWLRQRRRHWLGSPHGIPCLPVYRRGQA